MDFGVFEDILKDYQKSGVEWLISHPKALHCDDQGMGKTLMNLVELYERYGDRIQSHVIIFCPGYAMYGWKNQIKRWLDIDSFVYDETPKSRKKALDSWRSGKGISILIATYAMVSNLDILTKEMRINHIICDEIHSYVSGMFNHKSDTSISLQKFARRVPVLKQLTGTPVRKGVINLFAPLSRCNEAFFTSYWSFVNKWCNTFDTGFGKEIDRNPKDIVAFRNMLDNYMLRRMKRDYQKDIPVPVRETFIVKMSVKQETYYSQMETDMMFFNDEGGVILSPNQMTVQLRLRQLLVCPRILGINDNGAALDYTVQKITDIIPDEKQCAIFTPFAEALPFICDALEQSIKGVNLFVLQGGMKPKNFTSTWQSFMKCKENGVLICVIASAASFDAYTCKRSFFLGYEHDFNLNVQAEDRLCRLGQTETVRNEYLVYVDSIDDYLISRLNQKKIASDWIISSPEEFYKMQLHYRYIEKKEE